MGKSKIEQLQDYAGKSSMHALPIAITIPGLCSKVFWVTVWICGTIAATVHIYFQFKHFHSYPHNVNIVYISNDSLTFPTVTFANLSPLKKFDLQCETDDLQDLFAVQTIGDSSTCRVLNHDFADPFPLKKYWECVEENGTYHPAMLPNIPFCILGKIITKGDIASLPNSPNTTNPAPINRKKREVGSDSQTNAHDSSEATSDSTISNEVSRTDFTRSSQGSINTNHPGSSESTVRTNNPDSSEAASNTYLPGSTEVTSSNNLHNSSMQTSNSILDGSGEAGSGSNTDISETGGSSTLNPDVPRDSMTVMGNNNGLPNLDFNTNSTNYDWQYNDYYDYSEFDEQFWEKQLNIDPKNLYRHLLTSDITDDLTQVQNLIRFSEKVIYRHGFQMQDMIVSCSFNGRNCDDSMFTTTVDGKYGLLHSFNQEPAPGKEELLRTRKHGFNNGLRLVLNIHPDEYVGLLSSAYGIRVEVHSPTKRPHLGREGFNVGPGRMTSVGLTLKEIKRLNSPYQSNCSDNYPEDYKPFAFSEADFTMDECQSACIDYYLNSTCNCTERQQHSEYDDPELPNLCEILRSNETICRMKIYGRMALDASAPESIKCGCQNPCTDTTYEKTISSALWPTLSYQQTIAFNSQKKHDKLSEFLVNPKSFRNAHQHYYEVFYELGYKPLPLETLVGESLVYLHVYYEQLNYEQIVEEPSYEIKSFLADIGGILGLYIGMSLISFIEIFEAIGLCCFYGCCARKKSNKVATTIKPEDVYSGSIEY